MQLDLSQLSLIELIILKFKINMEAFKRIGIPLILICIIVLFIQHLIEKRK